MSRKKAAGITKEEVKNIKSEPEIKIDGTKTEEGAKKKSQIILATIDGVEVDPVLYFYAPEGEELLVPPFFNKMCGRPVNREDLNDVFSKFFKKEDEFLFYKTDNKEVYIVIPPLKFANVGSEFNSINGEFQKHAISFVNEGSVNVDTLKIQLNRVAKSLGYSNK